MVKILNHPEIFHLYYLITNDIREDIYSGISHVAEHTLLLPKEETIHFIGKGYTSINHVCLSFGCSSLEMIQKIDEGIMRGDVVTDENVVCAKRQVMQEIRRLAKNTRENEELISFVTNKRICKFATGDMEQINNIQTNDIQRWLSENNQRGNIYRFIFFDAREMISSTPILPPNITDKVSDIESLHDTGNDTILRFAPYGKSRLIQLYVRIPALLKKEELVKKAVFEYCIQSKIKATLGINVKMLDKFFDVDERFVVMGFLWDDSIEVSDILCMIRRIIIEIDEMDFIRYREAFMEFASLVMKQDESNFDIINAIKNSILYNTPKIQKTDLKIVQHIGYDSFPREKIVRIPIKVVIK